MPSITLTYANTVIKDASLWGTNPTTNYSVNSLDVGSAGSSGGLAARALLKFDLGLIPNDAIINSATLRLVNAGTNPARTIYIRRVTSDWIDTTVNYSNQPPYTTSDQVTFVNPGGSFGGVNQIDVKSLVQSWVSGSPNYGMIFIDSNESDNSNKRSNFDHSEASNTANRPTLTIDYTIPSTGKKQVEYVGSSSAATSSAATSITPNLPTGIQQGDLLFAHIIASSGSVSAPVGWTKLQELTNVQASGKTISLWYKFATNSESNPTFSTSSSVQWAVSVSAFRNVKQIGETTDRVYTSNTNPFSAPSLTTAYNKALLLSINSFTYQVSATPPLSFNELYDYAATGASVDLQLSMRYLHDKKTVDSSEMTVTLSQAGQGQTKALVLVPITNNPPTLTLTSPTDNLTLSEGNTYSIQGSASDVDNGNVVTIKYKINNGTTRALNSGVSDGSTPISFAKNLTYSNKRMWDGSTDVVGVDLAENTDHVLTVWAEDDQGGKSAEITRTFRVIHNRPPTIDGTDGDLGSKSAPFSQTYTVTEPEGSSFTITEMLNGVTKRTFTGTAGQQESFTITEDEWLRLDLGVQHEIRIRATDSQGLFSERVYTFTRTETEIVFELNYDNPDVVAFFGTLDAKPYRILVTLDAVVPEGADYIVEACNNFYDVAPVWEDITNAVKAKRGHIFVNETNSATQWAINIRVTAQRGTATERLIIKGFGGAFD